MPRSYRKNIRRTFRSTLNRFVAIFSIVALGVGFLAGLMASPPDMEDSMEVYLDQANLFDIRVVSTMGLTDADAEALEQLSGVEAVQPGYSVDLLIQTSDTDVVVGRAHSLPADAEGNPEGQGILNRLTLVEGRWPQAPGECVVEASTTGITRGFGIGDTFTATDDNEDLDTTLNTTTYTVVGTVHNAYYFSYEREPASVGSGTVDLVFYILPEDFAYETYTEIYLTVEGADELPSLEQQYKDLVAATVEEVEGIQDVRCDARYEEIVSEAQQEIDDAWVEYYDAEAEANQELGDAAQEIEDGRQALADGEQELADGEQEYQDGLAELEENEDKVRDGIEALDSAMAELVQAQADYEEGMRQIQDGEAQLGDAKKQLDEAQAKYDAGKKTYDDNLALIEEGEAQLATGKQQLEEAQAEYDAGKAAYDQGLAQIEAGEQELAEGKALLEEKQAEYDAGAAQLEQQAATLETARDQYNQLEQLGTLDDSYTQGVAELAEQCTRAEFSVTEEELDQLFGWIAAQPAESRPVDGAGMPAALAGYLRAILPESLTAEQVTTAQTTAGTLYYILQGLYPAVSTAESAAPQPSADMQNCILGLAQFAALDPASVQRSDVETLISVMQNLPVVELPADFQELFDGMQQLVTARGYLEAGIQEIQAQYAQQGMVITEEEARALFSAESLAAMDAQLTDGEAQIQAARQQLAQGKEQLDAGWAEYEENAALLADSRAQLEASLPQLEEGKAELDAGWAEYNENAARLAEGRAQLEASAPTLENAKQQLDEGWAQYNSKGDELYAAKRTLEDGKKQLDDGFAQLTDKQIELEDAQRQIADARQELADAAEELEDARQTIAEKKQELADGEIEYADAKAEAEQELADARAEIEDAEQEVRDIEQPEWYVWDRSDNVSFNSFESNMLKLSALTTVFPVFFFLVAALVVSTTMSRMVEEERLQIGTMKALGYTQGAIMQKYILYALTAALTGAIVGLVIGFSVFPQVIWSAYAMMYYMPKLYPVWHWNYALLAGGSLILCALAVTWSSCRATLRETPADLMRPRAPKAGKRILLERIGFLWRRLPFTYKVTCRNLLRYKKRFWMTVLGVAGCTALLVTGFGISDSLNAIITKQYEEIYHYDLMTAVTKPEYIESGEAYDYLFHSEDFKESLATCTEKVDQTDAAGDRVEAYLMVPQDVEAFADFADLHERISRTPTPLGEEGVILTEKLASLMGVEAGDTVTLTNSDGVQAQFTVAGVCEHYVYNYIYMSAQTYQNGFGNEPEWNTVLSQLSDLSEESHDRVSANLLAMDEVASLNFTEDNMAMVLNMLNAIDAVVVLIIICAAGLAFVVLYNLTNINIAERVKEIATIKVLGFYDREVDAYVNRESVALSVIGTLFGLVAGIALHRFIIITVEVDAVMFGRDIQPLSFVYAALLTMLFSLIVNLVMGRKLKKISMVESMKAPE